MTVDAEALPKNPVNLKISDDVSTLEDLFYLGYKESDPIIVFEDPEKNIKIEAVFRTLMPYEIRDISEVMGDYATTYARELTEKLETLARCIKYVNKSPLILSASEQEDFQKDHGKTPGPLDQARIVIVKKIKSTLIIDALYDTYQEFLVEISKAFEEIKKKLKNPNS